MPGKRSTSRRGKRPSETPCAGPSSPDSPRRSWRSERTGHSPSWPTEKRRTPPRRSRAPSRRRGASRSPSRPRQTSRSPSGRREWTPTSPELASRRRSASPVPVPAQSPPPPSREDCSLDVGPSRRQVLMSPPPSVSFVPGHNKRGRLEITQSTLTASSPECHDRRPRVKSLVIPAAPLVSLQRAVSPAPLRTPPRAQSPGIPRTPGYSSEERPPRAQLDFTRTNPVDVEVAPTSESGAPWDQLSQASSRSHSPQPGMQPDVPPQESPLSWFTIVDTVYQSGMVDKDTLSDSPPPVRSVIGGPPPPKRRRMALPPSPLTVACFDQAMRSCWGGRWSTHLQHQPPPANAALHPSPAAWVPDFKTRFHAGPGLDLKPARLSAREKEWAGTQQPPVEHSWMSDVDLMARAQLSSVSALEWLLGIVFDSHSHASPQQLLALRDFAARELAHVANFGGAIVAASTLARRKAILDKITTLPANTKNWLQLQPVGPTSAHGLFGPASASVPELIRQQPPPARAPPARRPPARNPAPRYTPQPQAARAPSRPAPSATYTPASARDSANAEPKPRQSRGTSNKASKRRT